MQDHWKDWDGQPVAEKPLIYQGIEQGAAGTLSAVSDEVLKVCEAINKSAAMVTWLIADVRCCGSVAGVQPCQMSGAGLVAVITRDPYRYHLTSGHHRHRRKDLNDETL